MIVIGLGTNFGDREAQMTTAVRALADFMHGIRLSRIFEASALLPAGATADMDRPYLNMAVRAECGLEPVMLLNELKRLEKMVGRVDRERWGPREIDLDILAWDDMLLESPRLTIPHRELLNREFALIPLADVAPEWQYPVLGPYYRKTPADIIAAKGYGLSDKLRETGLHIHV